MVRVLKINEKYRKILSYLARGDPTPIIIHNTGLKTQNFYKKLNCLHKYGYIKKQRVGKILDIQLQPLGIKELGIRSVGTQTVDYLRLHDVWVSYQILKKPRNWDTDFCEKILEERSLAYTKHSPRNWKGLFFDYASVKVRITPNKVMLNPPEIEVPLKDDPDHAKNIIFEYMDDVIPRIENIFKIGLNKPRKISVTVSSQHMAFVKNKIAKFFLDKGINLRVYDKQGRLRVIVDKSKGFDELEAINKAHAEEDAEKLKDLIQGTVTGDFNYKAINQILGHVSLNQKQFSDDLKYYGKNIASHVQAIKSLDVGIKELTELVKRINKE